MDRFQQKSKKDKHVRHKDNDKSHIVTDIKTIKENLKIKEILRTVKMNGSMRIKAPRGSKVMQNKDFEEFNDFSATEVDKVTNDKILLVDTADAEDIEDLNNTSLTERHENMTDTFQGENTTKSSETLNEQESDYDCAENSELKITANDDETGLENQSNVLEEVPNTSKLPEAVHIDKVEKTPPAKEEIVEMVLKRNDSTLHRDRKLSLDHSLLAHRESLSQSELDLHSIGKSPLERKSSFFRKKMDNFLKNTTEIFRRHSSHYKMQPAVQRRGSMSMSLQSLHEDRSYGNFEEVLQEQDPTLGSMSSLKSSSSLGLSSSSLSEHQLERSSRRVRGMAYSQPALYASQCAIDSSAENERDVSNAYSQEVLLNSRAISMSSGLDTAHTQTRRQATRSKRVTWLASEGLNNYLRRLIQDEKKTSIKGSHSVQDLSNIKENGAYSYKVDTKGRRLSYQRAVSGEDPAPARHQGASLRRKNNDKTSPKVLELLEAFSHAGLPRARDCVASRLSNEAIAYLEWAENKENYDSFFDWKLNDFIGPPPPTFDPRFDSRDFFQTRFPKELTKTEVERQAVIRELIATEADYILNIASIIEVCVTALYSLQNHGHLLDVDIDALFLNLPEILDANIAFWEYTVLPMVADAVENNVPFNTELLAPGFCYFREQFSPYERYVSEQAKALEYLKSLQSNPNFAIYDNWCSKQKCSRRLKLLDILVKPMQRLTKYSLLLRRLISQTDYEPERTSLIAMESFTTHYITDLNRAIRQREELEIVDRLNAIIESYEMDFKDEDMDRAYRMYAQINLKAPMANSLPNHSRSLIHEGDIKYKDIAKESWIDVHLFLFTDMLLVCKKSNKENYVWKMIRPKVMIEKLITFPKFEKNSSEIHSLMFIGLDVVGSSEYGFTLMEQKDRDPPIQNTLKIWEQKFKEAKLTYELGVWYAKNPSRDLSDVELETSSDYGASGSSKGKHNSDDMNIEREARERVAAMMHRSMGVSTEHDYSQASMATDSFDGDGTNTSGVRPIYNLRHPMHRTSTGGSSHNSRLSSFHQSTSASHDDGQPGPSRNYYRAGTSVEHFIPSMNPDDGMTSITVNVVSESESETIRPKDPPPNLQSVTACARNTLRVQPSSGVMALVHSLPDLTFDPPQTFQPHLHPHASQQSASEKHQSHELLRRNRLLALQQHQQQQKQPQQYLTPDHRGSSYPPPSPTRASLRRGFAFSYSMKNPPLFKMGHVNSQSAQPSTSFDPAQRNERVIGAVNPLLVPPPADRQSSKQQAKKDSIFGSRHKDGSSSRHDRDDKVD